jgi:outer membrane protein OmpA-like peptidoglycan-associated protein
MADLIKRSGATQVQVIGHTDNVGSSVYNQKLGLRRALSVGDELIRMGVSQKILKPISRGESYPTVPNNTEFNRSLNRRVVLELK